MILDQLETLFARGVGTDSKAGFLDTLIARAWDSEHRLSLVLAVRADALAHLFAASPEVTGTQPMVLPPLDREGARAAIRGPLRAARLGIEDALLERLLDDLERAHEGAHLLGASPSAIYPPHLQLVSSALYQALPHTESVLGLAHYQRIGGLSTVIGEYLERVLENQLGERNAVMMHAVFEALIGPDNQRRTAAPGELLEHARRRVSEWQAAGNGDERELLELLERLCAARLLVPVPGREGDASDTRWELVHDSLVAHVVAWLDARDRARREAKDIVRLHLRQSRRGPVSLLDRRELAQVAVYPRVLDELDSELQKRTDGERMLSAHELWARSRARLRRRVAALVLACAGAALAAFAGVDTWLHERSLRDRDVGRWRLVLAAFDWDAGEDRPLAVDTESLPRLGWRLYGRNPDAPGEVGAPLTDERRWSGFAQSVEAPGGRPGFLRVSGRGRAGETCAASWIPVARLPGYAERGKQPAIEVRVPTCAASRAGMAEVPGGPFYAEYPAEVVHLDTFLIDRTEVTNQAYQAFTSMRGVTGQDVPVVPRADVADGLDAPRRPRVYIDWFGARDYCRFMGKELPSDLEWQKTVRGGLRLDRDGLRVNAAPMRQVPWDASAEHAPGRLPANLLEVGRGSTALVGSFALDRSPYGVHDLAGNVQEWLADDAPGSAPGFKIVRGGSWGTAESQGLHTLAVPNQREAHFRDYRTGFRCALREPAPAFIR